MSKKVKVILALLALAVVIISVPGYTLYEELKKVSSEDPLVWESAISALEAKTAGRSKPGEAVVFVGSSSIRLWSTLAQDMAPIPVIQHGFGGAKLNDVVHFADRLVSAYRPRAVVVFAGTNDIDPRASKSPETLLASYQTFVAKVRMNQPALPVYYIGITPSLLRWEVWPTAQATNALIRQWTEQDDNHYFIDTGPALLGSDGTPDPDNYRIDRLHLSDKGYEIWTGIIRKQLLDTRSGFEVE